MKIELPEIICNLNNNKCKEHNEIYIDRSLPCPYPNCKEGIKSNKFIDIGINFNGKIEYNNKTTYERKSWNGIDGNAKYIWLDEKELYPRITNIIKDEVYKNVRDKSSDTIYHYTTLGTLDKILESNELWLTEWKCTNDKVEIKHGLEIAKEFNKDKLNLDNLVNTNNYFISSFSYEINKNTLFSSYADQGRGVAIEFDVKLNHLPRKDNFWYKNIDFMQLMPVIYDIEIQRKIMKYAFYILDIAKEWLFNQEDWSNSKKKVTKKERESILTESFLRDIAEIMAFFKDDTFEDERETRWLYRYDVNFIKEHRFNIKMKKFNEKNYYTSKDAHYMSVGSYYDIDDVDYNINLPIKSIILGSRIENKEKVIKNVKEQCTKFGFKDVDIKVSDIPYR